MKLDLDVAYELDQLTKEEFRRWIHSRAPQQALAATITFRRQSIALHEAHSAMKSYCRMLNLKAFGNTFKTGRNRLAIIPVQEGGESRTEKNIHYHLQIEIPAQWSTGSWMTAVVEKIKKIDEFGHEQHVVKPVTSSGWLDYCLKSRDKTSFVDAIDVANLWLH